MGGFLHQGIDTEWNRYHAILSTKLPAPPPIFRVMSHLNSFPRPSHMLKIAAGPTINTILLLKIQITQGLYWLWWEQISKMSFCWQLLGSYWLTLTPEERKVPLWTLGAGERAPWAADCFVEGLPVKWFKQDYAIIRHGGDKFTGAGSLWRQPSLTKTSRPEWREETDLCQGRQTFSPLYPLPTALKFSLIPGSVSQPQRPHQPHPAP